MDDDAEYPTICGTGTEDCFSGSYNFENKTTHQYEEFTTAYTGMPQVIRPNVSFNFYEKNMDAIKKSVGFLWY